MTSKIPAPKQSMRERFLEKFGRDLYPWVNHAAVPNDILAFIEAEVAEAYKRGQEDNAKLNIPKLEQINSDLKQIKEMLRKDK